jgi:hypothetical protein
MAVSLRVRRHSPTPALIIDLRTSSTGSVIEPMSAFGVTSGFALADADVRS